MSALRVFPLVRSRLKDRDRVKSLFRRSSSLSDLAYPKAAPSGRWRSVAERLEGEGSEGGGADGTEVGATSSSLASSASSIIHPPPPPPHHRHHHHHHHTTADASAAVECSGFTDKESSDSAVPSGPEDDEPRNHAVNGVGRRARSESSGEFSLSLDNEPWSRASSPARQPARQPPLTHPPSSSPSSCPPPSDTSTPRQRARPAPPPPGPRRHARAPLAASSPSHDDEEKSSLPSPLDDEEEEAAASGEAWPCRRSTVRRKGGSRRSSDAVVAVATRGATAGEAETPVRSPIAVLYVQGRASTSVSGCLNCFSSPLGGRDERARGRGFSPPPSGLLPRASSVISTAEGSSRRPKTAAAGPPPPANGIGEVEGQNEGSANRSGRGDTDEPVPPAKPPRDPAATAVAAATGHALTKPPLFCDESLFGTPFNFSSVFSDTVFTESVVAENGGEERNRTFLCLHPCRVRNASCPPLRQETEEPAETGQSQNGRRDGGGEEEGETTRAGEDVTARVSDDKRWMNVVG